MQTYNHVPITPDNERFPTKKYWQFSYFSTKTYIVGAY